MGIKEWWKKQSSLKKAYLLTFLIIYVLDVIFFLIDNIIYADKPLGHFSCWAGLGRGNCSFIGYLFNSFIFAPLLSWGVSILWLFTSIFGSPSEFLSLFTSKNLRSHPGDIILLLQIIVILSIPLMTCYKIFRYVRKKIKGS